MAQAVSKDAMLGRLKQVGCEGIEEGAISIGMALSGSTFFIPQPTRRIWARLADVLRSIGLFKDSTAERPKIILA